MFIEKLRLVSFSGLTLDNDSELLLPYSLTVTVSYS
jgi:hypothetical protein